MQDPPILAYLVQTDTPFPVNEKHEAGKLPGQNAGSLVGMYTLTHWLGIQRFQFAQQEETGIYGTMKYKTERIMHTKSRVRMSTGATTVLQPPWNQTPKSNIPITSQCIEKYSHRKILTGLLGTPKNKIIYLNAHVQIRTWIFFIHIQISRELNLVEVFFHYVNRYLG